MLNASSRWLSLAGLAATLVTLSGCTDTPAPLVPGEAPSPAAEADAGVITVTNTSNLGTGSLRQAIADAPDGAVIKFAPVLDGASIKLNAPLFITGKSLIIEGPMARGITLDGAGLTRVLINQGTLVLRNATITGGLSTAYDGGGGIINWGTLTLEHSTISGNRVIGDFFTPPGIGSGGGILNAGTLILVNSTISGNSAYWNGGGISVVPGFDGTITLIHSTVAENNARWQGGGLDVPSGSLILRGALLADNAAPLGANCVVASGKVMLLGASLASDPSCGSDAPMLVANPLLAALADNGGPTRTHALQAGSPAINAATACDAAIDQRYILRPRGGACDIGAFEFDYFVDVAVTLDASGTVNPSTGVAVLTGKLTCSRPVTVELQVDLNQQQKAKKVPTVVRATDITVVNCTGSKAWSIALAPSSGAFENGTASATAATVNTPNTVAPAATAATLKMAWGKR